MAKTKKPELTLEEKTAFLASLLPKDVVVKEIWKDGAQGKYFSEWRFYPVENRKPGWLFNFFPKDEMFSLDPSLSPINIYYESREGQVLEIAKTLKREILKKFGVEIHAFVVTASKLSSLIDLD